MNIEIANRLVKMRKAHGYSQEELAEKLGISRQAVSKWERAESSPDTDNLIMLSQLYGVSLDELLTSDEVPLKGSAKPEEKTGKKPKDSVHLSWKDGINVTDRDGSHVHVGWDGIRVNDKKEGERVFVGADDDEVDPGDFAYTNENGEWINTYINDIEVDENGVTFTENGVRSHHDWNSEKNGKKRFVHKLKNERTGKWRTTVVSEDGHKVVVDSSREIRDDEIGSKGITSEGGSAFRFPYAVLVTGVFLLLGFLKGWWHPAWVLFLTIPLFYTITGLIRSKKLNAFDIIVPVAVTGAYVALGSIYQIWHPLWLIMFLIPIYFAFSLAVRKRGGFSGRLTGVYTTLVVAAYITLGCIFQGKAWSVGWLLFLTIPLFDSIVTSIRKKRGASWIRRFPWEILIVAGYLFVGLMFGVWHPTWVAFLLIPVWRWIVNSIGRKNNDENGSCCVDAEDDDDDDD